MQRMLSVAALVGLGIAVWMFLSGGGMNQLAVNPNAPGSPSPRVGQSSLTPPTPGATPTTNQASWLSGLFGNSPTQPTTSGFQPTSAGGAAAPLNNGPIIRIASFNIQVFGKSKVENRPVVNVLAEVVRQFDVVAIQEIRSSDDYVLPNFISVVNAAGRHYDYIVGPPVGNSKEKEHFAYIYNADTIIVDQNSKYSIGDPDNLLSREPYVASFRTRVSPDEAFTFILVNVHTVPEPASTRDKEIEALAEVYRVVRLAGRGEDDVIMLGDFNADEKHLGRLGQIPGVAPLLRNVFSNTRQTHLEDNIIIHQPSTAEYYGDSYVFNLVKHFNLPLDWAEQVSDHFPVYAEFSAYERDYTGGIASRRGNVR